MVYITGEMYTIGFVCSLHSVYYFSYVVYIVYITGEMYTVGFVCSLHGVYYW